MITVEKALEIILSESQDFGVEKIPFMESLGRVLKEDIGADRDFPPFDRVSMDGIAINYDTYKKEISHFQLKAPKPLGQNNYR